MKHAMLTAGRLRELLRYDPSTGVFTRLVRTGNTTKIGDRAGGQRPDGYILIRVDGKSYLAHRLAWLWVTGEWPEIRLDHENRDKSDNRFCNLRMATQSQNMANITAHQDNPSGSKGASLDTTTNKWRAQIMINGKAKHIGLFSSALDANAAYLSAAKKYFGEFARLA